MLTINEAAPFFTDTGSNVWKCTSGKHLGHGMLDYYCRAGSLPLFGLTLLGLPLTEEIGVTGHPGVVLQVFERGVLACDPAHVLDYPPGAGDVYTMHLDSGPALAQIVHFLPTSVQSVSHAVALIDEVQALQSAIQTGLARVLTDLDQSRQ